MRALLTLFTASALLGLVAALDHSTVSSREHRLNRRGTSKTTPKCKNGFSLDPSKTQCICRPGKVTNVDRSKCLENCTSGSHPVGDGTCATCPAPFAKCSSRTVPTGCHDGFLLSAKACVTSCPVGTWADTAPTKNRCRNSSGYLFDGKCLALTEIPSGYYADQSTHTVEKCDANVTSCTCRGVGCALSCGKNKKNDQHLLTPKGVCDMHCPRGWYGNKRLGVCLACDSTMLTCDAGDALTCAKDSAGTQLYLTPTRKCVLSWKGPQASATFKKCTGGATSCAGPSECGALSCDVDTDGEPLFLRPCGYQKMRRSGNGNHASCVRRDKCSEEQYWADISTHTCRPCDGGAATCTGNGEGTATSCIRNQYLAPSGDCVSQSACPQRGALYASDEDNACRPCDAGALACTGPGAATACGVDVDGAQLYLHDGVCLTGAACPAGTFANEGDKTCSSCVARYGEDAASCTADEVTACTDGDRFNGGCIESCPHNVGVLVGDECILCSDRFVGSSTCTAAGPTSCARDDSASTLYVSGAACVTAVECPSGTYGSDGTGACEACTVFRSLVKTCDYQGALSCTSDSILYERGCFEECPAQAIPSGSTCQDCTAYIGTPCDVEKAQSCGLLVDEATLTCTDTCRVVPAGQGRPATYQDDGMCKACGGAGVDECTVDGRISACRWPFVLRYTSTNAAECIQLSACLADDLNIGYSFFAPSGDYQRGMCWQCAPWAQPNDDRTVCMV